MKKRAIQIISGCLGAIVLFVGMYSVGAVEALSRLVKNNVKDGATITLPVNEPTKEGYAFAGWQIKGISGGGVRFMSPENK